MFSFFYHLKVASDVVKTKFQYLGWNVEIRKGLWNFLQGTISAILKVGSTCQSDDNQLLHNCWACVSWQKRRDPGAGCCQLLNLVERDSDLCDYSQWEHCHQWWFTIQQSINIYITFFLEYQLDCLFVCCVSCAMCELLWVTLMI